MMRRWICFPRWDDHFPIGYVGLEDGVLSVVLWYRVRELLWAVWALALNLEMSHGGSHLNKQTVPVIYDCFLH